MNVLMTGGTGFIGSALCSHLLAEGHDITVLSRTPVAVRHGIHGISHFEALPADATFDAVINLAGEPIADKRWTTVQKNRICTSRLETTQNLITYLQTTHQKPNTMISGSAIGFYGVGTGNDEITEEAPGDESFSSQLCQQWEAAALQAQAMGIRTCLLRTGIVLGKEGGALKKMLLPFKLGLGGKIGHGHQWMPWIHRDDLINIILYCLHHDTMSGPVNGVSPNPVTNTVFTQTLGRALHRPTWFTLPAFAVKLLMGQMGEELLLSGKKLMPQKVLSAGFSFKYDSLDLALNRLL